MRLDFASAGAAVDAGCGGAGVTKTVETAGLAAGTGPAEWPTITVRVRKDAGPGPRPPAATMDVVA